MNISVLVFGGGVPMLRSADAATAAGAAELFLVAAPTDPLRRSTSERWAAHQVDSPDCPSGVLPADAIGAAIARARCDAILIVPAGYELSAGACATAGDAFDRDPALALWAGAISIETDDGVHQRLWMPRADSVVALLGDPRSAPPVWALRLAAWPGSVDRELEGFAIADLWVGVMAAGGATRIDRAPIARRPASLPSVWDAVVGSPAHLPAFERLLRKHASLVSCHVERLVIERELAFARLRDEHVRLLARRDAALAELDDLRARAAHHRAFLAHHRFETLDWGDLRRTDPLARDWGYERGGPVDRPFIAHFIAAHSSDVRGRVLEVQENELTTRFGGARVTRADVVDVDAANVNATVVADLRHAIGVPDETYDCVILTQTAHVIDDPGVVLRECRRILKRGGVLLATFPCASRVCLEYGPRGDLWRVTPAGAETIARRVFGSNVEISTFGNTLTQVAFLHGLGEAELTEPEMQVADPYNPMLVGVRARRASREPAPRRRRGRVLVYHRVEEGPAGPLDLNVAPELFAAQIDRLARGFEFVALADLLSSAPEDLPDNALAITFDDGYAHHLSAVAPMLRERRIPATFFVNSAGLAGPSEHWWDTLERVMIRGDGEGDDAWRIYDRCAGAESAEERDRLIEQIRRGASVQSAAARRVLTRGELRELATIPGMTIGAHGVDHLMVTKLTEDARRREMEACRAALEETCAIRVTLFAYPYGAVDTASATTARAVFEFAADCSASAVRESFDVARVPRLDVKTWDPGTLIVRIQGLDEGPDAPTPISFLP